MVLDEETLERMLASSRNREEPAKPPASLTDATDETEVYERPAPPQEPVQEAAPPAPAPQAPAQDPGHEEYPPRQHQPVQQPAAPPQPVPQQPPQPAPQPPAPQQPAPQPDPAAPPQQPVHQPATAPPAQQTQQPPQPAPAPTQAPTPPPVAPAAPAPSPEAPARPQVFQVQRPSATPRPTGQSTGGGDTPRIGLVQSQYNADVTDLMAQWARKHAQAAGAQMTTHHVTVPGVYDIPLTAKALAKRDDVDAIVVLGAVVQGETGHDELITRETARLMADLAYQFEKPVGLGIAGPRMTMAQAEGRIKMGRNAVESVIRQWRTLRQLRA